MGPTGGMRTRSGVFVAGPFDFNQILFIGGYKIMGPTGGMRTRSGVFVAGPFDFN